MEKNKIEDGESFVAMYKEFKELTYRTLDLAKDLNTNGLDVYTQTHLGNGVLGRALRFVNTVEEGGAKLIELRLQQDVYNDQYRVAVVENGFYEEAPSYYTPSQDDAALTLDSMKREFEGHGHLVRTFPCCVRLDWEAWEEQHTIDGKPTLDSEIKPDDMDMS